MTDFNKIKMIIGEILSLNKKIAVYPMSELGLRVVNICKELYGVDVLKIDNYFCEKNSNILPCAYLKGNKDYAVIVCSKNVEIYDELLNEIRKYITDDYIYSIDLPPKYRTTIG